MPRWSSTTREQYATAFHQGMLKGRVSWNLYLLKTTALAMGITFGRLVLAIRYRELNAKTAPLYVLGTGVCLAVSLLCLAYRLARPVEEEPTAPSVALFVGVTALIVLAFCLPKLL